MLAGTTDSRSGSGKEKPVTSCGQPVKTAYRFQGEYGSFTLLALVSRDLGRRDRTRMTESPPIHSLVKRPRQPLPQTEAT